jgi:hypothetical protein
MPDLLPGGTVSLITSEKTGVKGIGRVMYSQFPDLDT